jgi:DNA-binding SARP family transcriptional activator
MERLVLALLGGFEARRETGEPIEVAGRKAQALLAFLALPPGATHLRDKLAALLWPELAAAPARANLRQVLFALRHALAFADPLRIDGDTVALNPARVDVDAAAFERACAESRPELLAEAIALYKGDLLTGLRVQEPPYEEWLAVQRERLRERALEGLARLLAHQRSRGDAGAAVQTALRLLALDPLQEPVHRALMRLYAALGRRGDALRQYHLCVSSLRRDLDVDPEIETKELYQDILRRRATAPAADGTGSAGSDGLLDDPAGLRWRSVDDVPLVGRAPEWTLLADAVTAAWAGTPRGVALIGEAGIGKSRLVRELIGEVVRRGGKVAAGLAFETEQVLPFRPWIDALRTGGLIRDGQLVDGLSPLRRSALGHVFPEADPASAPAGGFDFLRLFEAVTELLQAAAGDQPLLLVLEDLQWADEMSLRLLAFICRQLRDDAVLVLVTLRDGEPGATPVLRHTVDELQRNGRLAPLRIGPLSRAETALLAAQLGPSGPRPPELDEQIWQASRGNPFIVVETLRALGAGALQGAAAALPVATAVRDLVARQLDRLSDVGRRVATAAAVIGQEFDFALLPQIADLDEERSAEAVEELVRHRVLHEVGGRFDLVHDLVRQIVYDQILPQRRALLHRRVAAALEAVHGDNLAPHVTALATHYRLAGAWHEAANYLERAALAAAAHSAHRDAASLFEQTLLALGRLPGTQDTRRRACELQFRLGYSLSLTGRFEHALEQYDAAVRLAEGLDDEKGLWFARGGRASVLTSLGRYAEGLTLAEQVCSGTVATSDHRGHFWTHIQLARVRHALGDYRQSVTHCRQASACLELTPSMEGIGPDYPPGVAWRYFLLLDLAMLGAFDEGAIVAEEVDAFGRAEGDASVYRRAYAWSCLGFFHAARGELERAVALLEPAFDLCRRTEAMRPFARGASALASAYMLTGRVPEAISILEDVIGQMREAHFAYLMDELECRLGEAHLSAGHLAEADGILSVALRRARTSGARGVEAEVLRALGELAGRQPGRDREEAVSLVEAAAILADWLGMRPLGARCRLELGRLRHLEGRSDHAQVLLGQAASEFREMGMSLWPFRAEAAIRAGRSRS